MCVEKSKLFQKKASVSVSPVRGEEWESCSMYLLARIPILFCIVVFIMGDSVDVFSSPADTEPVEAVFSDAPIIVMIFREKIRAVNVRINSRRGCFHGCTSALWYTIFSFLLTLVFSFAVQVQIYIIISCHSFLFFFFFSFFLGFNFKILIVLNISTYEEITVLTQYYY